MIILNSVNNNLNTMVSSCPYQVTKHCSTITYSTCFLLDRTLALILWCGYAVKNLIYYCYYHNNIGELTTPVEVFHCTTRQCKYHVIL